MTFEQLSVFVAVAEREHVTRAAEALRLTPSAVSAAVKALESFYGVRLFDRVGRGIELTETGRDFLGEAKATLARVRSAETLLHDLGGLKRGTINIHASQTIANYWLPARLIRFHEAYPAITINLTLENTQGVTQAVLEGVADLGFIEGTIDQPSLSQQTVAIDELVVVVSSGHWLAGTKELRAGDLITNTAFVMREAGSGTRSEFEAALRELEIDPADLRIALELASNEAVISAVLAGNSAAAVSRLVAQPFIGSRELAVLPVPLPPRAFIALRHKERRSSAAVTELAALCGTEASAKAGQRSRAKPSP